MTDNKINGFPGAACGAAPQTSFRMEGTPPDSPSITHSEISEIAAFFIRLMADDRLQSFLAQHLAKDVLLMEVKRRDLVEPLMSCKEVAQTLGITHHGLYKRIQHNELGIPYVLIGRGGGYKFDPRDVREFIRKQKIHPVMKPASLRRKAAR